MPQQRNESNRPDRLLPALAFFALAFWLYYASLRQVLGPLNPDEIYFSHILWLLDQGKRQYVDFHSIHLPTYFQLLKPLVTATSAASTDLSFIWYLRGLSALVIAAYVAIAFKLHRLARSTLPGTIALLLVFVVLARMVEVRTDTIGLLLVNTAWAIGLGGRTTRRMAGAALLAGSAVLFSARAGAMAGIFGLLLLALSFRSRDWAGVRALLAVAALFVVAGVAAYLVAPEWVALIVRSCFIEPTKILAGAVPLHVRFLAPERVPLAVMIVGGLLAGVRILWKERSERGVVITVACGAQLLMVLADPNAHQYIYGWAAVPAVLGLAVASRAFTAAFPAFIAAALIGAALFFGVIQGQAPPTSAYYRLTFDAPFADGEVAKLSTTDLLDLLVTDRRQQNLANQLRVRSELCRRLQAPVMATFDTNPVCLPDVLFDWTGLFWPPLLEGDVPWPGAVSREAFEKSFLAAQPRVIVWAHRYGAPRPLLPSTRQMLACCYDIREGYALRAVQK